MEIECDICGASFTNEDEIAEFMRFDFEMGEISQYPNLHVKFDVCQDCFIDAFPVYFLSVDDDDGQTVEEVAENNINMSNSRHWEN